MFSWQLDSENLCFKLLLFVYDHKLGRVGTQTCSLVLVLLPLISLMVNQVTNLKLCGVSTAIISGSDNQQKSTGYPKRFKNP